MNSYRQTHVKKKLFEMITGMNSFRRVTLSKLPRAMKQPAGCCISQNNQFLTFRACQSGKSSQFRIFGDFSNKNAASNDAVVNSDYKTFTQSFDTQKEVLVRYNIPVSRLEFIEN